MMNIHQRLNELSKFEPGWDGYNGKPTTLEAIATALRFAEGLQFVPGPDGSIQIEIHQQGIDLEIEVSPQGEIKSIAIETLKPADPAI